MEAAISAWTAELGLLGILGVTVKPSHPSPADSLAELFSPISTRQLMSARLTFFVHDLHHAAAKQKHASEAFPLSLSASKSSQLSPIEHRVLLSDFCLNHHYDLATPTNIDMAEGEHDPFQGQGAEDEEDYELAGPMVVAKLEVREETCGRRQGADHGRSTASRSRTAKSWRRKACTR